MGMFSDLNKINKQEQSPSRHVRKRATTPPAGPRPSVAVGTDLSEKSTKKVVDEDNVTPDLRPSGRTPVRVKRSITRNPFEIFVDQLDSLRSFSLEEKNRGEKGSMSQMVREALDDYISKRRQKD